MDNDELLLFAAGQKKWARSNAERKAHQARARHGGKAPEWAGADGKPRPAPKPKPIPEPKKPSAVPAPEPKPVAGKFGNDTAHPEDWNPSPEDDHEFNRIERNMAWDRMRQASRNLYLHFKNKIGKNDELYAEGQAGQKEFKSISDFQAHMGRLVNIAVKNGVDFSSAVDNKDHFANIAIEGYKKDRDQYITEHKPIAPRPAAGDVPIPIHEKVPAPVKEKLQLYRKANIVSIKQTGSGGINSEANDTIQLEGDGKAIMKGISPIRGSTYGCPSSEVCAYELAAAMGFDCMAPTTYRMDHGSKEKKDYPHSVQSFVEDAVPGESVWSPPPQTEKLKNSVSMMVAFDFAMGNRDRNPGNYMLDKKRNVMVGIDNGLVGLEAGRGVMGASDIMGYCRRNAIDYCSRLIGENPSFVVKKEHVEAARKFVNSPAYEEVMLRHWGSGTPGAKENDKISVTPEEYVRNCKKVSEKRLEFLDKMLGGMKI